MVEMKSISDENVLREALSAERAMIFFHAMWGYSPFSIKVVEKWERAWVQQNRTEIATFIAVDGGDYYPPAVSQWLKAEGLEALAYSGNGEMLWLESGRIVSKLATADRFRGISSDELARHTTELWS